MLVTSYDSSDAYWTEEEVLEMKGESPEEHKFTKPGYQDDLDEMYLDDFKWGVKEAFSKRKFPLVLRANNSNWRGQTGYAKADNVEDILSKLFNFDSSYYKLHRTRGGALHFALGTHDVPQGFTIDIKPYNAAYWNDNA